MIASFYEAHSETYSVFSLYLWFWFNDFYEISVIDLFVYSKFSIYEGVAMAN